MNVKMRILGVIGVLSVGGLVFAGNENNLTPEEYCNKYFSDTSLVMELRQESFDSKKSEVKVIAKSRFSNGDGELVDQIVEEAYRFPYTSNYTKKQEYTEEFKNAGFKNCMNYKEDKKDKAF